MASQDKKPVDPARRRVLTIATSAVGGVGAVFAAVPFVASFQPSARTKAIGAPVEVDISQLEPGQRIIAKWRGKPVWIMRRTKETLAALETLKDELSDPESAKSLQPEYARNVARAAKPEYAVLIGICTHLGCSPTYMPVNESHGMGPDWKGGFVCPCHGSRFDMSGRVYKNFPAPTNLEVPPYTFLSDTRILVGAEEGKS
ncbi:MAG: ubiquinol-cytochrome c reductase iron-sulfur subunit [Gammaproteobacteria bacterium]